MKWTLAVNESGIWQHILAFFGSIYQVILSLGGPGLFVLALADSSFLSIPEGNDLLMVVLSTGQTWGMMTYYAAMTTAGSVAGCSLLYLVGRRGGSFVERRLDSERMQRVGRLYRRWGVLAIIVPSLLPPPTPFKVFVLSAGIFGIRYPKFFFSVLIGRGIRYFSWGALAVLYGEQAKVLLERHFQVVGLILLGIMIAGILAFVIYRMKTRRKASQGEAA